MPFITTLLQNWLVIECSGLASVVNPALDGAHVLVRVSYGSNGPGLGCYTRLRRGTHSRLDQATLAPLTVCSLQRQISAPSPG